ncbi:MAG: DUF177 domain-containing protein [Lachnospiraceae bacterium]|nr:DUF177 domain-containing protein [Lachnospiraceae bacterium]
MLINLSDVFLDKVPQLDMTVECDEKNVVVASDSYEMQDAGLIHLTVRYVQQDRVDVVCEYDCKVMLQCDRCLEPVSVPISVRYEDTISTVDEEFGCEFLEDYKLDLTGLVLSEITLNWPTKVLCREDCKGICSICGANLNSGDCGCDRFVPNPAFAGLAEIFNTGKEV